MKMKLLLTDPGYPLAYHPELLKIAGSINATILLCQLVYWVGKQKDLSGWIYKTSKELQEETGLTKDQQETARKCLKERGILEEKRKGIPPIIHYRICRQKLLQKWEEYRINRGDSPQLKKKKAAVKEEETYKEQFGDIPARISESTSQITTETISESTQENNQENTFAASSMTSFLKKLKEEKENPLDSEAWKAAGEVVKSKRYRSK